MINKCQKIIYLEDKEFFSSEIFYINIEDYIISPYISNKKLEGGSKSSLVDFSPLIPPNKVSTLSSIEIYRPESDQYVSFKDMGGEKSALSIEFLDLKIIMLRYESNNFLKITSFQQKNESKTIKERDRLRTIQDILKYVKKWRNESQKRKINLQEAAKVVGLSKKSLDDYFYHLRIAEKYEFDFIEHLKNKISYLRKFVQEKLSHQKQDLKITHKKIPKQLKILNTIIFQNQASKQKAPNEKVEEKQEQKIINGQQIPSEKQNSLSSISQFWHKLGVNNHMVQYSDDDSFFNQFHRNNQCDYFSFSQLIQKDGK